MSGSAPARARATPRDDPRRDASGGPILSSGTRGDPGPAVTLFDYRRGHLPRHRLAGRRAISRGWPRSRRRRRPATRGSVGGQPQRRQAPGRVEVHRPAGQADAGDGRLGRPCGHMIRPELAGIRHRQADRVRHIPARDRHARPLREQPQQARAASGSLPPGGTDARARPGPSPGSGRRPRRGRRSGSACNPSGPGACPRRSRGSGGSAARPRDRPARPASSG